MFNRMIMWGFKTEYISIFWTREIVLPIKMDAKQTTKSKSSTLPGRFQQRPVSAPYNGGFFGKLKRRFRLKSKNYDFETDSNTNVQCIYFKQGNEELTDNNKDVADNSKHDKRSFDLFRSVSERSPSKPSNLKNKYEKEPTNKKHSNVVKNSTNPCQNSPTSQNRFDLNDPCVNNDFIISSDSGVIDLDHEAHGVSGHNDVISDIDLDPGYETLDEIRRKLQIKVPPKVVTSEPKESETEPAICRSTQHRRCQSSGTSEKFLSCMTDLDPRRDSGLGSPLVSDGPGSLRTSSCLTRNSTTSDTDILGCHGNSRLGYRDQNELLISSNLVSLKMNSCPLRQDFKDNSAFLDSENYQIDNQIACNSDTCLVQSPSKFQDPISELYANPKILLQKKSQKAEKAGQMKNKLGSLSSGCVKSDACVCQDHETCSSQFVQQKNTESAFSNDMDTEPPPIPERKYSLDNILDSGICEPNLGESEIHDSKSNFTNDEFDRTENHNDEGHVLIQSDHPDSDNTTTENSKSLCSDTKNVCDNDASKSYHIGSVFNETDIIQTSYEFNSEGKVQSITCMKRKCENDKSLSLFEKNNASCSSTSSYSANSEKIEAYCDPRSDSVKNSSSEMVKNRKSSDTVQKRLRSDNVQNKPSSETVQNRLSSETEQKRLSSETVQNTLSSETEQKRLSSEIVQNKTSSEIVQNRLSSEMAQNRLSSEMAQNSAPKTCNPGYYGGLRFGWEVENTNSLSLDTETAESSASNKFESDSLNDIQILDRLYEGAMTDSQISYEDDADAILENLNTDLYIDESSLNIDTESSVTTNLNQKVSSDTKIKSAKVRSTRPKSEHHARSKKSSNDRHSEPFARLPDFYYHDNEPVHMSLSELGVSPPRRNSGDCNDINLEELRRIRPKMNKSKSSKKSSHSSHSNQKRDSGHLDDEFGLSKSELDERPPAVIPREKLIKDNKCHQDFMESMRQLKDCGWYWGPLSWDEAEIKLTNKPDGSFLVNLAFGLNPIHMIVRRDHIDQLPIPTRMKNYLNEAQYYVECLGDD
ncbi:hypothetical protein KUTeg_001484 [Tegillarca granosa]|uniref:Uncharacterized protein n=1 Tax=Tegillarca granosa TaxID=220873 RepID=A0ABQ9FRJ2_TEGGR|nr:hypothetical protein KUTeg_001484 [Tegillarca granosa]